MKNAITVIDQERIDLFKELASKAENENEYCITLNLNIFNDFISDHESLIEINAELTKREQKHKSSLAVCANYLSHALNLDEIECEEDKASIHAKINDFLMSVNEELKGDSDE